MQWLSLIPEAAYITDVNGVILQYNETAVALWGYEPERGKALGAERCKFYTTAGVHISTENSPVAMCLRKGNAASNQAMILYRPDGSKRLVITHPKRLYDQAGVWTGVIAVLTDISDVADAAQFRQMPGGTGPELKGIAAALEEKVRIGKAAMDVKHGELKQSEERYHKMIAEVEDYAILLLDADGIVQNWNIGAEKIKGYKESEIVGKYFGVFYTQSDRKAGLPEKLIGEAMSKGKAIHEGWRQRKDGTLFWGSIVITALHDTSGEVIGFSKVTRDLTARRVSEERLRRYSRELEFQNRELQQFAYAAAHDMKEPLRKLRFYNSSLLDTLAGRLSEKEEQYLRRATDAAARMQHLIDDLLAYSKASTEGGGIDQVDLAQIVEEAKSAYHDLIDETKAVVEIGDLPMVAGIAFQLRQLFENLLGNALKYSDPQRAPVVHIECERVFYSPPENTGLGEQGRDYYRIKVADNGIGFESHKAEKIFDIFQRLDNRGRFPGTGIGLAISRRVVQNHKGFIYASGELGKGAEFTIYLPVERKSGDEEDDNYFDLIGVGDTGITPAG